MALVSARNRDGVTRRFSAAPQQPAQRSSDIKDKSARQGIIAAFAAAADEKQVQAAKKKQPNKGGVYFPIAACQVKTRQAECNIQLLAQHLQQQTLLDCAVVQLCAAVVNGLLPTGWLCAAVKQLKSRCSSSQKHSSVVGTAEECRRPPFAAANAIAECKRQTANT
jgi:hypothetical protein